VLGSQIHYKGALGFMRLKGLKFLNFLMLFCLTAPASSQAAGIWTTCTTVLKTSIASTSKARAQYLKDSKAIILDEPLVRYISHNSINLESVSHEHLLGLIREFRGSPVERFLRSQSKVIFHFDPKANDTTIDASSFGFRIVRIPSDHRMAEHFLYAVGHLYFEDFVSKQSHLVSELDRIAFKSKKFSGEPKAIYALGFSIFHGSAGLLRSLDPDFQKFISISIDAYGPRTLDAFAKKKARP